MASCLCVRLQSVCPSQTYVSLLFGLLCHHIRILKAGPSRKSLSSAKNAPNLHKNLSAMKPFSNKTTEIRDMEKHFSKRTNSEVTLAIVRLNFTQRMGFQRQPNPTLVQQVRRHESKICSPESTTHFSQSRTQCYLVLMCSVVMEGPLIRNNHIQILP